MQIWARVTDRATPGVSACRGKSPEGMLGSAVGRDGFGGEDLLAVGLGRSGCGVCATGVRRAAGLDVCATSRGGVTDVDEHAASITASTTPISEGVDLQARGSLLQDGGYATAPTRDLTGAAHRCRERLVDHPKVVRARSDFSSQLFAKSFAVSSSRRSYASRMPSAIPLWTMPSRSST